MLRTVFTKSLVVLLAFTAVSGFTGCKKENRIIDKVTFELSENLEVVRVSLVFRPRIKSGLQAQFSLMNYGLIFMNPFINEQSPFEIGFELDTDIVNEQEYVHLEPTLYLPNGARTGVPHAIVEVRGNDPIHHQFDLFGYVDVLRASWLGAAGIFSFMDDRYFPRGLTISQVFLRDDGGNAGVIAHVFGPELRPDGTLSRRGGLAVFANVRQLIDQLGVYQPGRTIELKGENQVTVAGRNAGKYRDPRRLAEVQENLIKGMNSSRRPLPGVRNRF